MKYDKTIFIDGFKNRKPIKIPIHINGGNNKISPVAEAALRAIARDLIEYERKSIRKIEERDSEIKSRVKLGSKTMFQSMTFNLKLKEA
jgi:hypothetical protein